MKNVLITGATGYIGCSLLPKLVAKYNVSVIIRMNSNIAPLKNYIDKIKIYRFDGTYSSISDAIKLCRPDITIHLATYFIPQHTWRDIDAIVDSNIKFGLYILEALKEIDATNFINTGTYWQHYNNSEYEPVNLYAASKQAFMDLLKYYESLHGFSALTLTLPDVYGPNDKRPKVVNLIIDAAKTGKELKLSKGEQYLDLLYIDDVIEAYVSCVDRMLNGDKLYGEYFLTSGKPITIQELVRVVSEVVGRELPNLKFGELPYRTREFFTPICFGRSLPFWQPKVTLHDGIRKIIGSDSVETDG